MNSGIDFNTIAKHELLLLDPQVKPSLQTQLKLIELNQDKIDRHARCLADNGERTWLAEQGFMQWLVDNGYQRWLIDQGYIKGVAELDPDYLADNGWIDYLAENGYVKWLKDNGFIQWLLDNDYVSYSWYSAED